MKRLRNVHLFTSFQQFKTLILALLIPAFLMGCGEVSLDLPSLNNQSSSGLSGTALMFSTSFNGTLSKVRESDIRAFSCLVGSASIHALDADGSINSTALATSTIDSDGHYQFSSSQLANVSLSLSVQYVVKASGCGNDYYRPITGTNEQDISGLSTLVSLSSYIEDPSKRKLTSFTPTQLTSGLANFSGVSATSLTTMIDQILADATLRQKYQNLIGVDISLLKEIPPQNVIVNGPSTALENGSYTYSAATSTWNDNYVPAYEWSLEGAVVSSVSTWTYSTSKNSQGNRVISLRVGSSDGFGNLDTTKPVKTVTKETVVSNNFPPEPPDLTLVGNINVNARPGSVNLNTGTLLANCDSFSDLALVEGSLVTPQSSDFTITCATSGSQSVPFLLSTGDGTKTMALWARDAAGNISSSPKTLSVNLDQTNPSITLGSLTSVKGGASYNINYTATDAGSGLVSVKIAYAQDGTTFSDLAEVIGNDSPLAWNVPAVDVLTAKIRIRATDLAGNSSQLMSSAFTIDSRAPSLTISSPPANSAAQTGITLAGTCEDGLNVILSGGVTPSPQTIPCSSGSYSQAITFSAADGTKNIVVKQTDSAGNVTTLNRDFLKDTTAPSLTFTSPDASTHAQSGVVITGTCETGLTINISGSGVDSASTTSCTAGNFSKAITFSAVDGTKTVTISQTDAAGNSTTVSRDFARDNATPNMLLTGPPDGTSAPTGVTLLGTCDNAYAVVVSGSGTSSGGSYTCSSGAFSIPITFTATDGNKSVTVSQTDAISNTTSFSRTYVKDTAAPTFTQTALATTYYSSADTVTYQGACETGLAVVISGAETTSLACSGSNWTFATDKTSDGSYAYTFKQTDAAGNETSVNATWIRDATAPTVSLTSLTGGQLIKGNQNVSITWTASDITGLAASPINLEYSLNGGTSWNSITSNLANSGSYTWALPGYNSSTVRVRVKANDLAGNISTSSSATNFTVDSIAPLLALTTLLGAQVIAGGQSYPITWTATDSNMGSTPISIDVSSNGGTSWSSVASSLSNSGTYSWTVPAVNSSSYRIRITATDSLGQSSSASSTSNFTIDSTAPSVTLTSHTGGQYVPAGSNQSITWSASDTNFSSTPITISLSSNSGSTWTVIADSVANSGSYSWTASSTTGSNYRVKITARDSVGNTASSSSSSNFTVSSGAPVITQTSLASPYVSSTATQVTFGGACQTGLNISVTGQETTNISCLAGTWSLTAAVQSSDGTYDYTFSQTNTASETSSVTARWQRITTAPTITGVTINNGDDYTPTPSVTVTVTTSQSTGVKVRFANATSASASCQAQYADSGWIEQTNMTSTHAVVLSSGDGNKKVCVWAKDIAGNVSVYSPVEGTSGVDTDTINFASGNPPRIIAFDVISNSGGANQGSQTAYANDGLKITWTITDIEGLANNPVYLDYTTDGSIWTPIEAGYGSLSGNPTSFSSDYYGFSAPTSSFFRIRIRAKDLAGNTSSELYSKAFNVFPWAVVAGNLGRGEGGSAKSVSILRSSISIRNFAINPLNSDIYYLDAGTAVMKVSGQTGVAKKFLSHGSSLASTSSGTLDSTKSIDTEVDSLLFDKKGYLYIFTGVKNPSSSAKVFRVNPETLAYTTYLSGGTAIDNSATASNVFVAPGSLFAFDESSSLYFATNCTPGTWQFTSAPYSRLRLMKVVQNSDGTPGSVNIVAGNCVAGTPVSGQSAVSTPFAISDSNVHRARLAVWNNGNAIYYSQYTNGSLHKIINGVYYTTAVSTSSTPDLEYNAFEGLLYVTRDSVKAWQPSLSGNNGETEVTSKRILASSNSAGCTDDSIPTASVCGSYFGAYSSPSGRMFFVEGGSTTNRLRYVDDSGNIQTMVGSLSFSGNNGPASLARGLFAGIYYKNSSEPYNVTYPEGLYFLENKGGVFGYFDTTWSTHNIWGNQSGNTTVSTGTTVGPSLSLGTLGSASSGNTMAMAFNNQGLPWFRHSGNLLGSLDQDKKYVTHLGTAISSNWFEAPAGADPRGYRLSTYGGIQNFTFASSSKLFLLGTFYSTGNAVSSSNDPNVKLRAFDYDNNNVVHVMGDVTSGVTPQQTSIGSLQAKSISSVCRNDGCSVNYTQDQDRLYFAEGTALRYITSPLNPTHHTLIDVFSASATITNFTVSPNRKYIFYVMNGSLYCHAISSADNSAICNNAVSSHVNLGPPSGLSTLDKGPNQFTWKNDSTLFISNYKGEIYQYTVSH